MRLAPTLAVLTSLVALASAPIAHAGGPTLELGAAEDAVRGATPLAARTQLALLRLAGLTTVRVTTAWQPGQVAPSASELAILRNVETAASLAGVKVYLSVVPSGSAVTPLTPEAQEQLAATVASLVRSLPTFDDVVIGNEPNLSRSWQPQFGPDGSVASAPAYLSLLARTYDAVKAADPGARVWGGATSSRGNDRVDATRPTTSPTAFVRALGAAYRASGRTTPVMDGYVHHPQPDSSSQSPDVAHPTTATIGLADYDTLVGLLGEAFDGTAQPGSTLPIVYGALGIETRIPSGKASLYSGSEPVTTGAVGERTQAAHYETALRLAFCQPNVRALLIFHARDETSLAGWQSGVFYADGTPKSSMYAVRDALRRTRGGSIARCDGLSLRVRLLSVRFPTPASFADGDRIVRFVCELDCSWEVRAVRSDGRTLATTRGWARARATVTASLARRPLGRQPLRLEILAVHPVNPGTPWLRRSVELRAG